MNDDDFFRYGFLSVVEDEEANAVGKSVCSIIIGVVVLRDMDFEAVEQSAGGVVYLGINLALHVAVVGVGDNVHHSRI